MASWRPGTLKQYNVYVKKFKEFCKKHRLHTSDMILCKFVEKELLNFHVCLQNSIRCFQKKKCVEFQHNKTDNPLKAVLNSR